MKLVKLVETLTKNIDLMVSTQESFNNTFTLLQNYTTQEFNEMDYQLKLQIEECESMYNEALKQHNEKIQILEKELKEKEYTVSQDYLKRTDELEREYQNRGDELARERIISTGNVILTEDEHNKLTSCIENHENLLETTVKDLNEKHKRDLSAALGTMKLLDVLLDG